MDKWPTDYLIKEKYLMMIVQVILRLTDTIVQNGSDLTLAREVIDTMLQILQLYGERIKKMDKQAENGDLLLLDRIAVLEGRVTNEN